MHFSSSVLAIVQLFILCQCRWHQYFLSCGRWEFSDKREASLTSAHRAKLQTWTKMIGGRDGERWGKNEKGGGRGRGLKAGWRFWKNKPNVSPNRCYTFTRSGSVSSCCCCCCKYLITEHISQRANHPSAPPPRAVPKTALLFEKPNAQSWVSNTWKNGLEKAGSGRLERDQLRELLPKKKADGKKRK